MFLAVRSLSYTTPPHTRAGTTSTSISIFEFLHHFLFKHNDKIQIEKKSVKELMDSNLQQQQQQKMSSGLTRYRSAPSSYFSSLLSSSHKGDDDLDHFINSRLSNRTDFSNPVDFGIPTKPKRELQQQQQQQQQMNDYTFETKKYDPNSSAMDNSYGLVAPINQDRSIQMKMSGGGGTNSSLIRHSSSPAGLFDEFEASNWFKKDLGFSSLGEMAPISETEVKSQRKDDNYNTSFKDASWDDSAILSDEFLNGLVDGDSKLFSSIKSTDTQSRPPNLLSHHLSLPTSRAELSAQEKYSEDTVLCKIRAKRGFATHPRSIAERVRRTRISERMRKLQELVPNMDKQTNTSDMLDLAVDYIKDLEKQRRALQDRRDKCTCSNV